MTKIIFSDIDGTLLNCDKNSPYPSRITYDGIHDLRQNGHLFCLATGRCFAYLEQEILDLEHDALILANGGMVIYQDEIVSLNTLDQDFVLDFVNYCNSLSIDWVVEGIYQAVCPLKCFAMYDFFRRFKMPVEHILNELPEDFSALKVAVICHNQERADLFYEKYHQDYQLMRHLDGCSFDLYPKNVSKAKAFELILQLTKMEQKDTIAFGDGSNDGEMLRFANIGVAMANASNSLKEIADDITLDALDNGVIHYLKKLNLIA